jgi:hypothetical protein
MRNRILLAFCVLLCAVAVADVNIIGSISQATRSFLDDGNYQISFGGAAPAVNLVPTMTGNTSPTGTCSASSTLGGDYDAWAAFNQDNLNNKSFFTASGGVPAWLQYQFGDGAKIVTRYTIKTRYSEDVTGRKPQDFNLSGSTNGTDWVVLDEKAGQFSVDTTLASQTYTTTNQTAYEYYRLNVSTNWGNAYLAIGELELWGYTP